ncbi:galactose mutarotase [Neobacillus notoginsengisoli]|uniref:Aldose 1-epimerase n=1 Tax=Neobacillus notoginsengisoli TaxID=1578198 RepID=A0A417YVZ6_9BACI|nr:aldose epimerase family protein [Neobacillus notoginsengisoli]RHW41458.1 galactose mutarotase [Neobacillus notoginsengisoli]
MEITKKKIGELGGSEVTAYTVKGKNGMTMTCLDYGCIITEFIVPDREGKLENIVLGFDNIEDYVEHSPYFGAVVGRIAGRIKEGRFTLDGKDYHMAKNNGENHLHGGERGLDKVIWNLETKIETDKAQLIFTYESPDGEEGYPGNVSLRTVYTITDQNELVIEYNGTTDKKTILNLTNHTYFNLSGNAKSTILEHTLQIDSDKFLELDSGLMPTGRLLDVEGTAFDFRNGRKVADGPASSHPQNILAGKGYDHPFVLNRKKQPAIKVSCEESGRTLEVETNQPAVVLYTSNQLEGDFLINGNVKAERYLALCLETQKHPDAINHPDFPSVVLDKGEEYYSYTKYSFKVE